jgi:hypothetical protein
MERYTRKDIDQEGYEIKGCGCQGDYMPITDNEPDMIDKLGQIEDIEEELGMPLDKAIDLLFKSIKNSEFYDCLTCTNVMHNERGCDGNCSHNKEFSRKEILELLELEEEFRGE